MKLTEEFYVQKEFWSGFFCILFHPNVGVDCISINVILGGDNLVFIWGSQAGERLGVSVYYSFRRTSRSFLY